MKEALFEVIDRLGGELTALSDDIFDHPEVGYEEYRASGLLCDLLEREGFAVERGIAGIPTAFRAVYENGVGGLPWACSASTTPWRASGTPAAITPRALRSGRGPGGQRDGEGSAVQAGDLWHPGGGRRWAERSR